MAFIGFWLVSHRGGRVPVIITTRMLQKAELTESRTFITVQKPLGLLKTKATDVKLHHWEKKKKPWGWINTSFSPASWIKAAVLVPVWQQDCSVWTRLTPQMFHSNFYLHQSPSFAYWGGWTASCRELENCQSLEAFLQHRRMPSGRVFLQTRNQKLFSFLLLQADSESRSLPSPHIWKNASNIQPDLSFCWPTNQTVNKKSSRLLNCKANARYTPSESFMLQPCRLTCTSVHAQTPWRKSGGKVT